MRLTLATYFLTLGVSLFYVVCARPALITESLKSLSLQPRNPTQALQPHSSTLRISLYPPGNPDDPDNSPKFNSRNRSAQEVITRFLNQMRYRHHADLDLTHVAWQNYWHPNSKDIEFIVEDDDVDGRCHSFCLAMVDIPSKEQYRNPAFQIHGTLATANSEDWEELHATHEQNRPRGR
ncbi:hypothetical protein F5051DRAFT_401248 [Lentinula edodes]|nr:hypothetical protein F5051DRAFT_401248 [Lentinula edodes]